MAEELLALDNLTGSSEVSNATMDSSHPLGVDTSLSSKVFITVLYMLILLVGTTGNVLTIWLVMKRCSLQSCQQGTVHYHLVSLALSDILILLISIPIELYNFIWFHYPWVFGDAGCRSYYFLRDVCSYATVLNIASLSCERYLAICHPIRAKLLMSRRRTKRILSAIWLSSFLFALPMAFIMGVRYQNTTQEGESDPSSLVCTSLVSNATLKIFIQVNAFVSFVLPVTLIGGLNCVTVSQLESLRSRSCLSLESSCKNHGASKEIHKTHKSLSSSTLQSKIAVGGACEKKDLVVYSEPHRIQALQHSIYMLRAIVIAYVVCWLPYHARRLMFCYIPDEDWSGFLYTFYHYFYMLTNTLFYVSSAVNPVLYNVVSTSYRQLFLKMIGLSCSTESSPSVSSSCRSRQ